MPRPKRSYGNPNGNTVDAYRGVSAEALRAKRLAKNTPAGQQDENRLVSYDPGAVRAAIEARLCPFCGAGPYKNIALHTGKLHGIDASELRVIAGLPPNHSICDPHLRTIQAAHLLSFRTKVTAQQIEQIQQLYSEGLREVDIAARFEIGQAAVGRILHRSGASTRNGSEHRRKLDPKMIPEIVSLYKSGMLQREIGDRFGVSQTRVSQILRNHQSATDDGSGT